IRPFGASLLRAMPRICGRCPSALPRISGRSHRERRSTGYAPVAFVRFPTRRSAVRLIRPGEQGPAVTAIRSILVTLGLPPPSEDSAIFDTPMERAVRVFQQQRGLSVDGAVGDETWRALDAARWNLGARTLDFSVNNPLHGDDVRQLQERLLEMGYDVGR